MNNLLVLACGEGTRNAMFTFDNAMPKCLLSAGDKTILEAILASYKELTDHMYVCCLPKHADQIRSVLDFRKVANVTVVPVEPAANAMQSLIASIKCLKELGVNVEEHCWYVNWSDVHAQLPSRKPGFNTIFIDNDSRHRNLAFCSAERGIVVESTLDSTGNVPGIFYVNGDTLINCVAKNGDDMADFDKFLANEGKVNLQKLNIVYDYGDYDKFTTNLRNFYRGHQSRYFNDISVQPNSILKRPVDQKGLELHQIELAYYKNIAQRVGSFARMLSYDRSTYTMELEKITGGTCQSKLDECTSAQSKLRMAEKLLQKFDDAISEVHALPVVDRVPEDEVNDAIRDEFVHAMSRRVGPVMPLIKDVVSRGIKSIDGMPITESYDKLYNAVMCWCERKIEDHYFNDGITHGDPNTDNCMLDKQGNIKFIDPRGYFGRLKQLGYGIKQYDYAKFIYGMTGYSRFNRAQYIATKLYEGNVETLIGVSETSGIADVDIFQLDVEDDIKILVGIIWVKLSSYIINDPERSVLAYLYGNALLTKLLNIK